MSKCRWPQIAVMFLKIGWMRLDCRVPSDPSIFGLEGWSLPRGRLEDGISYLALFLPVSDLWSSSCPGSSARVSPIIMHIPSKRLGIQTSDGCTEVCSGRHIMSQPVCQYHVSAVRIQRLEKISAIRIQMSEVSRTEDEKKQMENSPRF